MCALTGRSLGARPRAVLGLSGWLLVLSSSTFQGAHDSVLDGMPRRRYGKEIACATSSRDIDVYSIVVCGRHFVTAMYDHLCASPPCST